MRKIILHTNWLIAGLLFASADLLYAQEASTTSSYQPPGLFGGAGVTFPFGAVIQGGGYGKNGWGGGIHFVGTIGPSEHQPSDYDGGKGLFGEGRDNVDPDKFVLVGLSAHKLLPLDKGTAYISLELGPSLIFAKQADNFVPVLNPCTTDPFTGIRFCKPNYTYEQVSKFGTGGFIRSAIHVRLFDQYGVSLGLFTHLNTVRNHFGVDLVATGGIFRKRNP
jgi:hypothetical protein